jgi:hypothetical protein
MHVCIVVEWCVCAGACGVCVGADLPAVTPSSTLVPKKKVTSCIRGYVYVMFDHISVQ